MDAANFTVFLYFWITLAILLIPVQIKVTAPYGRHSSPKWGPSIPNKLGWVLMEIISPLCLLYFFLQGAPRHFAPEWFFAGLWLLHYLNRSLIFPFRIKTKGKRIPIAIVLFAMIFNLVNGSTNGYYLGSIGDPYPADWFSDIRFILGFLIFLLGAGINIWSDQILLNLRKPGETGYSIPRGGLFRWISCPNHFGEIIEWAGFAILCWNLPALGFAIWTIANLIPRALSHHRWYRQHFSEYPSERKAIFPYLF